MKLRNLTPKEKDIFYDPANKEDAFWSALISMLSLVALVLGVWVSSLF